MNNMSLSRKHSCAILALASTWVSRCPMHRASYVAVRGLDCQAIQTRYRDPDDLSLPMFQQHSVISRVGIDESIPLAVYSDATPCRAKVRDSQKMNQWERNNML